MCSANIWHGVPNICCLPAAAEREARHCCSRGRWKKGEEEGVTLTKGAWTPGMAEEERKRQAQGCCPGDAILYYKKNMSLNDKICTHMLVEFGKHGRISDLVGKGPKASCKSAPQVTYHIEFLDETRMGSCSAGNSNMAMKTRLQQRRLWFWSSDTSLWRPGAAEWGAAMRRLQPEERRRIRQFRQVESSLFSRESNC